MGVRGRRRCSAWLSVAVMTAGGWIALGLTVHRGPVDLGSPGLWVYGSLVLLGEVLLASTPTHQSAINTSTVFALALLLRAGAPSAVLALAMASLLANLVIRRSLVKAVTTVAIYSLALVAAGATMQVLAHGSLWTGVDRFRVGQLPAIAGVGLIFVFVGVSLDGLVNALLHDAPMLAGLQPFFGVEAISAIAVMALAPVVDVAAKTSLALPPLLVLPLIAVQRTAAVSRAKEHQALHDVLTGLPNRALFRDRMHQAIAAARRSHHLVAVMVIDLDRFKEVNDTLGHHVGDLLLAQVGPRLAGCLRESDTVARLGGDEFGIVLPALLDYETAPKVAAKLLSALDEPFMVHGLELDVGASIGVTLFPEHGEDPDALLQRADVAMYQAKQQTGGFEIYALDRDPHSVGRLAMSTDLRRAVEEGQLTLFYQPKADLRTGRVIGVEALLRWRHPQRGLIQPDDFIPLAERTGLIRPIALWVLNEALAQTNLWRHEGLALSMAVNLSVRNLHDFAITEDLATLLERWEVPAHLLQLEITESSIMHDPAHAMAVLTTLDGMGLRLAIDDFGTGYSSLAYLKRLPVSELKIDKSFVISMTTDESDAVIVRSTIELARNLGLRVVAEGVETAEAWNQLNALRCDVAQGFYLSPAVPAQALTDWLQRQRRRELWVPGRNGSPASVVEE
jgi:diguanylate cyclase (GGDEF)-like protein